jgi:FKBP-type peptidyl-prolyl cis-trans isomerase SlyD
MQIKANQVVTLRYKMFNGKEEIVEDILKGPAITYVHGAGKILPALEAQLSGMLAMEERTIYLKRDDYPDALDDDFRVEIIIDEIRPATDEELDCGIVRQTIGEDVCGDDCIC